LIVKLLRNKSHRLSSSLNIQPYTFVVCLFIIGGWLLSALHHGLSLFETQKSNLLLSYGAANGTSLQKAEYWKLITSQFVHVKFYHMLFNMGYIYYIGAKIEKFFGATVFISIYLATGISGQLASILSYPQFVLRSITSPVWDCGCIFGISSLSTADFQNHSRLG
jgi:membrane associated rhomboid family serine protease